MKYSVSILLMLPGKGESKYDYNKDEAQLCLRTTMMAKVRTNIIYNNENHRPVSSHLQTLSHTVVYLTLIEIRTHFISGDRH
jgi:hypothetical protein